MPVKILTATRIQSIEPAAIPNGQYRGTWGGYDITVQINGDLYMLKTDMGIRTIAAACTVKVKDGSFEIELDADKK